MAITQDQIFTFFGGGLVVFVLEQVFHHFQKEKRVLGYTIDTRVIAEKSHADLKITFKDMDVQKVLFHGICLKNIGNASIKDFPVFIQADGKFYFAKIYAKPGIEFKKIENKNSLEFKVTLLNPGEEIKVDYTILDAPDEKIVVDARSELLRVKNITSAHSAADILDVMLEGSSGITWALIKLIKITLKK